MTAKELYDYITSEMSPEDALLKLLETTVEQNEALNIKEGVGGSPVFIIASCAMQLGWSFAIPKDEEEVIGMCVGTQEYMNQMFPQI